MTNLAAKQVKDVLEGMLGRDVLVHDGVPLPIDSAPRPTIATYVDDTHSLATVAVMDFALTAYAGAALGLVPRGGAEAAIEDRELPASLLENAAEVLNVLAAPLTEAGGAHQRLLEAYGPDRLPPAQVSAWCATLGSRLDLDVEVSGYGHGRLSFVATHGCGCRTVA